MHALPLYKKLGGTIIVSSKEAQAKLSSYNLPVICIDNVSPNMQTQLDRMRSKLGLPTRSLTLGYEHRRTFRFLDENAEVVIFYELFEFTKWTGLKKPKKVFLTHGNMLKSYFSMYPKRKETIKQYDYMAGLGPIVKKHFIETDGIDPRQLVDIGVARTDELHDLRKDRSLRTRIAKEVGFDASKRVISYIPTFWGASSIYNTGKAALRAVDDSCIVFLKLHPQVPAAIRQEYEAIVSSRNNVYWADEKKYPSLTLPAMLSISDAVLGDVSSVILEAILLDVPLVFLYDVGEHRQKPSDYKIIPEVVGWSEHVDMENAVEINKVLKTAFSRGINKGIWRFTKDRIFFNYNGTSAHAIAEFIRKIASKA